MSEHLEGTGVECDCEGCLSDRLTEARATIERLETEVKRMTTERDEARRVARVWQNEMAEEQRRHNAEAMEVQSEARATIERLRRAIKQSHGKQDHGPTCYLCAALESIKADAVVLAAKYPTGHIVVKAGDALAATPTSEPQHEPYGVDGQTPYRPPTSEPLQMP